MSMPAMLLVSGVPLVQLGPGRRWKPLAMVSPVGMAGLIGLVAGIVDIILAVMALTQGGGFGYGWRLV